jgi:hypothetical protein
MLPLRQGELLFYGVPYLFILGLKLVTQLPLDLSVYVHV